MPWYQMALTTAALTEAFANLLMDTHLDFVRQVTISGEWIWKRE